MEHQQGTFHGTGDLDLFYQSWRPNRAPRAVLAFLHGSGDHSGRIERLVSPLAAHDFAVYAFDQRGFGRSPGRTGHINAWSEYREDVRAFLELIHQQNLGVPRFLMGYSLGAAVALDFVLHNHEGLSGVILSGAPFEPAGVATPLQIALARLLSNIWPTFAIQMTNDIQGVTRDPSVIQALQQDPLHHSWVTARWGAESLDAMDWVRAHAGDISLPVLFIHGSDDPFNLVRGTQRYFDQVTYLDKTLIIYSGSRHETHNDLDHEKVAKDIIDWIGKHL
jgi:alpha-beta hydrolase superfamily lysophospholipase